jgi:predicted phosphodiesterase
MNIQYISDIHLEFRKNFEIEPVAENLVLCGDIGYPEELNYQKFIQSCATKFKNVFVIFGNHEYYNNRNTEHKITMNEKKQYVKYFSSNVYFLDNSAVYINQFTNEIQEKGDENCFKIIGSTLWSNVCESSSRAMNDTHLIYKDRDIKLTGTDIQQLHKESVKYIVEELDRNKKIPCILLTHHGPHISCFGKNRSSKLISSYVSHIPELYEKKNLLACISGHTHSSVAKSCNGILFLSNQLGYPYEKEYLTDFKSGRVLKIEM